MQFISLIIFLYSVPHWHNYGKCSIKFDIRYKPFCWLKSTHESLYMLMSTHIHQIQFDKISLTFARKSCIVLTIRIIIIYVGFILHKFHHLWPTSLKISYERFFNGKVKSTLKSNEFVLMFVNFEKKSN